MTNRQKTTFFDSFGLQAFFNNFLPISPKWVNIKVLSQFQRRYSVKIFSVYDILSLFCSVVYPEWFLNENMSSRAGLNKTFSFSCKSTICGHFRVPRSKLRVIFFNLGEFYGISSRKVNENIVPSVELSVSTGMWFLHFNSIQNPWF